MRLPPNYAATIEQEGFAIVAVVLSATQTDSLVRAVEQTAASTSVVGVHGLRNLLGKVPTVRRVAASEAVRRLVEPVLGAGAFAVRGLWLDKIPTANWRVAWHQDLTVAVCERREAAGFSAWSIKDAVPHVQPPIEILSRMLAVRLHLDDSHAATGPLRVIPRSHVKGRLSADEIAQWSQGGANVACLAPRGGAVVMRPLLLHASSAAENASHRRVIHLEFAAEELPAGLAWHERVGGDAARLP